ncbi:hypothetical protein MSAN_02384000 [Mycena sanguinolenta]|uniref:Uncharacterized protein n=1 Tax=Mycena sanguinolenta TaxID=230812 RepID=A0A8H7CFN9_9AGAR|nr:hypothetical protein MSAN_02384000 [Mycena sanguinolenta]
MPYSLGMASAVFCHRQPLRCCFFLRVTAVWYPSKIAYAVFSILWVAVLGAGITVPVETRAAHIGPTQCITTVLPANVEVAAIVPLIHDTTIFLAVTYRILAHMIVTDSHMAQLRIFFGGRGLSTLLRALLQSGQYFYLITVVTHIALLILLKLPHFPSVYRGMGSVPAFALINAMACLVFRKIKFGLISSDGTSKIATSCHSDFHATANPRSLPLHFRHTDSSPSTTEFGTNTTSPLDIRVEIDKVDVGADESQETSKPTNLA